MLALSKFIKELVCQKVVYDLFGKGYQLPKDTQERRIDFEIYINQLPTQRIICAPIKSLKSTMTATNKAGAQTHRAQRKESEAASDDLSRAEESNYVLAKTMSSKISPIRNNIESTMLAFDASKVDDVKSSMAKILKIDDQKKVSVQREFF